MDTWCQNTPPGDVDINRWSFEVVRTCLLAELEMFGAPPRTASRLSAVADSLSNCEVAPNAYAFMRHSQRDLYGRSILSWLLPLKFEVRTPCLKNIERSVRYKPLNRFRVRYYTRRATVMRACFLSTLIVTLHWDVQGNQRRKRIPLFGKSRDCDVRCSFPNAPIITKHRRTRQRKVNGQFCSQLFHVFTL